MGYILRLPTEDYDLSDIQFRSTFREKLKEKGKLAEFLKNIEELQINSIDVSLFKQRMIHLFQNHKYLILDVNTYLKNFQITLPVHDNQQRLHQDHHQQQVHHTRGKKKIKKAVENYELPWDVLLHKISRKLDLDDLFQFGGVCKMWRKIQKIRLRTSMASQDPLIVHLSKVTESCSFISICYQKFHHSKMLNNFWNILFHGYHGCSSGYLIMTSENSTFLLLNPFTRRKMVIDNSTFKVNFKCFACRVLLAFVKGSKEFVLLALCSDNLHVYQSRNLCWVTYPKLKFLLVDFAVFHNIIYVVNDHMEIGVLSLDSTNINFLKLKSAPKFSYNSHIRLISCDGQLLVLHIMEIGFVKPVLNVYKVDFSTMSYVKMENLGDIALFYAPRKRYYALSNPSKWGYKRNYVYVLDRHLGKCRVYKGNADKMPEYILPVEHERLVPPVSKYHMDWCFRNRRHEIDYSLVK